MSEHLFLPSMASRLLLNAVNEEAGKGDLVFKEAARYLALFPTNCGSTRSTCIRTSLAAVVSPPSNREGGCLKRLGLAYWNLIQY